MTEPLPTTNTSAVKRRRIHPIPATLLGVSVLLWLGVSLCFATRADAVAAVTLLPSWFWAIVGMLLWLATIRHAPRKLLVTVLALWLVFLACFMDELPGLLRFFPSETIPKERRLRVVSLNCAGGSAEAAKEAGEQDADILLLQETPGPAEIVAVTMQIFGNAGGSAPGLDGSIIARGTVTPLPLEGKARMDFTPARVTLLSGRTLYVISLRLTPPVFRMDLWNPENWRVQTQNRKARREQMQGIRDYLKTLPADAMILLGGDFNAPARDSIFRELAARNLTDAFAASGRGWGDTIINDMPFHRIDQIWTNADRLCPIRAYVRQTVSSDHRMLIVDFALPE